MTSNNNHNVYRVNTDWKIYDVLAKDTEQALRKFRTITKKEFPGGIPRSAKNVKSISIVASDVYE